MALRLALTLSLLVQQLLVWPCLALCNLPGGCNPSNPCCEADCPPSDSARNVTGCSESACAPASACEATPCEPESCNAADECSAICFLACASAVEPPLRDAPSAPTLPPHSDFIKMLALPVAFIAAVDRVEFAATGWPEVRTGHSFWNAGQRRAMLCCWLI